MLPVGRVGKVPHLFGVSYIRDPAVDPQAAGSPAQRPTRRADLPHKSTRLPSRPSRPGLDDSCADSTARVVTIATRSVSEMGHVLAKLRRDASAAAQSARIAKDLVSEIRVPPECALATASRCPGRAACSRTSTRPPGATAHPGSGYRSTSVLGRPSQQACRGREGPSATVLQAALERPRLRIAWFVASRQAGHERPAPAGS